VKEGVKIKLTIELNQDGSWKSVLLRRGKSEVKLSSDMIRRGVESGTYRSPAEVVGAAVGVVSRDDFETGDSLASALGINVRSGGAM